MLTKIKMKVKINFAQNIYKKCTNALYASNRFFDLYSIFYEYVKKIKI